MHTAFKTTALRNLVRLSTKKEQKQLQAAGFVHVTGLLMQIKNSEGLVPAPRPEEYGRFKVTPSLVGIVTLGGEIWIVMRDSSTTPAMNDAIAAVVRTFAPHGNGAPIPGTNGERFIPADILRRINNPYWEAIYAEHPSCTV